jgi:AraC-like DNA-binding protein
MRDPLQEINVEIEEKNNQYLITFLFLVVGIFFINAFLFYFLDCFPITLIDIATIFCLLTGYIIFNNKTWINVSFETMHIISLIVLTVSIYLSSLYIGNKQPVVYIWFLAIALSAYMVHNIIHAISWLVGSLFISLSTRIVAEKYNLYSSRLFSPGEITIVNYTNIVLFIILFATLIYFLNEFQKLKVKKAIITDGIKDSLNFDIDNNTDQNLAAKKEVTIDTEKLENLFLEIERYYETKHPHRDPNFNGYKLAAELSNNLNNITKAITYKRGLTIKSLTNYYRVKEIKQKLIDKEHTKYTLKHLYTSAGFTSQTTFNRAFKEVEGITPTEFIERLG